MRRIILLGMTLTTFVGLDGSTTAQTSGASAHAPALVALGWVARLSAGPANEALANLLDPMRDGFFFWSRVTWGLLAPLLLAPFVVKTARMKSNQAATGLLYVGLVFVLVGELLAAYLTRRSGLPV